MSILLLALTCILTSAFLVVLAMAIVRYGHVADELTHDDSDGERLTGLLHGRSNSFAAAQGNVARAVRNDTGMVP